MSGAVKTADTADWQYAHILWQKRGLRIEEFAEMPRRIQLAYIASEELATEHPLNDDQYGCDIFNKINDEGLTPEYIENDLPVMLEDTFASDERITGISDVSYQILSHDSVHIQFVAATIYGNVNVEGVITNNGD